ncbi:MAG: right-handed parallel beta-helix repeat-containing protein [Candidatus Latescibacterota bacterium]
MRKMLRVESWPPVRRGRSAGVSQGVGVSVLSTAFLLAAGFALLAPGPAAARGCYVDAATGSDTNPGTAAQPFRTVSAGVACARAGDTVWIATGVYREMVSLNRGGSDAAHPLTLRARPGAQVSIRGSDLVTGWQHHAGDVYRRDAWPVNSQQVFVDGQPLRQIGRGSPFHDRVYDGRPILPAVGQGRADMQPGTFWYSRADSVLYVWLTEGSDPGRHVVEVSVRNWIVPPWVGRSVNHVVIRDLHFAHSNQTCQGQAMGLVCVWGYGWRLTNCTFAYGDFNGVRIMGGGHRITDCVFKYNGAVGINITGSDAAHGWRTWADRPPQKIVLEGNDTSHNNYRGFDRAWNAGGIKAIPSCTDVSVLGHRAVGNNGPGIWFDGLCRQIRIDGCRVEGNQGSGIFFEISDGAAIANNLVVDNAQIGIYVAASDSAWVVNNTVVGNWTGIALHGMPRDEHPTLAHNRVTNNIIAENTWADLVLYVDPERAADNTADHNLYYRADGTVRISTTADRRFPVTHTRLDQLAVQTGQERNSLFADPLWADRPGGDYSLRRGSPAIDAGVSGLPQSGDKDIRGMSRALGGNGDLRRHVDLGAFEYSDVR